MFTNISECFWVVHVVPRLIGPKCCLHEVVVHLLRIRNAQGGPVFRLRPCLDPARPLLNHQLHLEAALQPVFCIEVFDLVPGNDGGVNIFSLNQHGTVFILNKKRFNIVAGV